MASRINDKGDEELMCGAGGHWFVPRDGKINVVRENWDQPGVTVCDDCINRLASHRKVNPDGPEDNFKCTCGSLDPEKQVCKVHGGLVQPPEGTVM